MSTDPNHPAFPTSDNFNHVIGGLTKREYFAGKALAAMLSNPLNRHVSNREIIAAVYGHADAMCGNRPVAETLAALRDRIQVRHDLIQPLVILGVGAVNLSPHQRGMQYAFAEVVKAIDELLK